MSNQSQQANEDLLQPSNMPNKKQLIEDVGARSVNKLPAMIVAAFACFALVIIAGALFQRANLQNKKLEITSKKDVINPSTQFAKQVIKQTSGLIEKSVDFIGLGSAQNIPAKFEYNTTSTSNITNNQIITSSDNLIAAQKNEVLAKLKELAKNDPALAEKLKGLTDEQILQMVANGELAPVVLSDGSVFGNKNNMAIKDNPAIDVNLPINNKQKLIAQGNNDIGNNLNQADDITAKLKQEFVAGQAKDIRRKYPNLSAFDDETLVAMAQAGKLESMNNSMQHFTVANNDKPTKDDELNDGLDEVNTENAQDEMRNQIKQMRLQMAQQALMAKTTVTFKVEEGKADKYPNSNARFSQFGQIKARNTSFNNKKQNQAANVQNELKAVQFELNNQDTYDMSDEEVYVYTNYQ